MNNASIINEENILQKLDNETKEKMLTPRNDYVFKRIFGRKGNENLLKSLLEAILNIKIKSLKLGESTELLPNEINEKEGILDVKTILEDGTKVDIEIQNAKRDNIVKRAHFYLGRLYTEMKVGSYYSELKKSIVIFISNFELLTNIKEYHTVWRMTEKENVKEHFEEYELHFIELPKFLKTKYNKEDELSQWLLFLDYTKKEMVEEVMKTNKEIKEAEENMEKIKTDAHEQYLAWLREKYELDMNSSRHEGLEEGIEKGVEKGLKEGKREVAKKLKEMGMELKKIAEATGLKIEEIKNI